MNVPDFVVPDLVIPNFVVKVCGITRREDAVVAVDAGAAALGFIFFPKSPRYVAPKIAGELGEGLPVWKVGIFVNEGPALIEAVMEAAHLDIAQIYGGEAPPHARVWKAFRMSKPFSPASMKDCEAVLLDGAANGQSFDWTIASEMKQRKPATRMILAGGLDAANVGEAIRVARPWGVDASSRLESAPGVKDHAKVRDFVQAALGASKRDAVKEKP
jgi:phosphoribosylanthranilate isomerase